MDLKEFKALAIYKAELKQEKESTLKSKQFASLVPLVLTKFEYTCPYIRDYLDVDNTFGVVVSKYHKLTFHDALNLYQSVRDIVIDTTYCKVVNEGLIDLGEYQGFWIQLA